MPDGRNNKNHQRTRPYTPLQRGELARMVANRLLQQDCIPLDHAVAHRFLGAGVYALYYHGEFPLYLPLKNAGQCAIPIYVGKAEAEGRRTGGIDIEADMYLGDSLHRRLREHHNSIDQAFNLKVEDFSCRYLVVEDIWIPLAEALLIQRFKPLWNVVVSGFGIHAPGSGRSQQRRSDWDMLHPGRQFAKQQPRGASPREIAKRVRQHLAQTITGP